VATLEPRPTAQSREPSAGALAVLLNLPAGVVLVLVLAWPVLYAGWLSLHEVSLRQLRSGELPFAGLANYARLFGDDVFWLSLRHTVVFVAVAVALEVVIGLAIALVIDDERVALSRLTRVLLLVPWGVPPVVNGLLWSFVFNAQYGYLNRALLAVGAIREPVNWLGDPTLAMGAVVTAYVWRTTPFNILLYHAGLRGIPRDCYEAAAVDGASGWARFWHISLPLLRPVIAVTLILRTTFAFMVFDEIFAITQGGPGNATWVAGWYTYRAAFQPPFNIGLGSASAWVMALILGAAALVYARLVGRRLEA
jgi:multiple sugar transport system permease protein